MINWMAGAGALGLLGVSARWNWWRPRAEGLPVLMYHKIGDAPEGSRLGKLWVSTAQFRRQMDYLKRGGYSSLTFLDLARLEQEGKPLPKGAVVITFDDGYRNNFENALPVLKEYGFKAVIFLVLNALERDNFWHDPASEARIPMLSWGEINDMKSYGIEFGSHTLNHPRLEKLDDAAAEREIRESRRLLSERLGYEPVSFAYPYGNGQDQLRLQQMVKAAGYRWAVSVHQGKADIDRNPFCLKRIFVRGDDTSLDFHLHMTRGKSRF